MKAGVDPGNIVTILLIVIYFGGAVVNEIVKQIKKKQAQKRLEEQLAQGKSATQPPPEFEVVEEEETEEDEEEEEKPQEAEMPKDVKDIFEQIFGRRPVQQSPSVRPMPLPKQVRVVKQAVELSPVQEQKQIIYAEPVSMEPIPLERRILKNLGLSEAQKLVVYSEILGKPKALRMRHKN